MKNTDVFSKILLVDKPINWTSFDVVKKIRSQVKKKYNLSKVKVGHCGTLDPLATGLLIIFIGSKTKEIIHYENLNKKYVARIKLGHTTKSFDRETPEINTKQYTHISENNIFEICNKFIGKQLQLPPIFSAIKLNGEPLYKKARRGEVNIKIKKREITIFTLNVLNINLPYIDITVKCSKGTYIRSLANDIGEKLNCGGYLYNLKRSEIGELKLDGTFHILEKLYKWTCCIVFFSL